MAKNSIKVSLNNPIFGKTEFTSEVEVWRWDGEKWITEDEFEYRYFNDTETIEYKS